MSSDDDKDINIPAEQMNEFFFMNEDEEKEKYGQTTKVPDSLISGQIQKQVKVNKVSAISAILNLTLILSCFLFRPTN